MAGEGVRAFGAGLLAAARAPLLVAGILLAMLLAAAPFGAVVASRVQASLANEPPLDPGAGPIDPDWWVEFRAEAKGIEATFTPAVLGFAAPLDNLSAMLDGTRRWALAGPAVTAVLVWAFLWGGILDRFVRGRAAGPRGFLSASWRHLPRMAIVSATAVPVVLALYATVHAVLFGPVYGWLAAHASSERNAFLWRVVLYAVFTAMLAAVGLVADYARIAIVTGRAGGVREAIRDGAAFARRRFPAVATLAVLGGAMFVAMLAAYGAVEILGGSRVGGWRAVVLGQAYIVARLWLRVAVAAGEVRLFRTGS